MATDTIPTVPKTTYEDRLHRVQQTLAEQEVDWLFLGPSADLFYLTGFDAHVSERLNLLMIPRTGDPPMIGDTPTTGAGPSSTASLSSGTARIGAMLTTGLLGATNTTSALPMASSTPAAGFAASAPTKTKRWVARCDLFVSKRVEIRMWRTSRRRRESRVQRCRRGFATRWGERCWRRSSAR